MDKTKRGKKLGDVVGSRHPIAAFVFIFIGIILSLSLLDYTNGQEIYLRHYFEPFLQSTVVSGNNICGKIGATFCTASYLAIGISTFMIPVYLIWFGIMCIQRSAYIISKKMLFTTIVALMLFAILLSIMQASISNDVMQSAQYPSGWGGKLGSFVFENFLQQFLNITGSALLIGSLYSFCLIVIFVDSPMEAAKEIAGVAKKSPSIFTRVFKIVWGGITYLPKKFWLKQIEKYHNEKYLDEDIIMPVKKKSKKAQKIVEEEIEEQIVEESEEPIDAPQSESTQESNDDDNNADFAQPIFDTEGRYDEEDDDEEPIDYPQSTQQEKDVQFTVAKAVKEEVVEIKQPVKKGDYIFPSVELLNLPSVNENDDDEDFKARFDEIVETLSHFGGLKVEPKRVSTGPVITRYEVLPAKGVKISKIASLENDIAMRLKAMQVRVIAPVPGAGTVGFEVPNKNRKNVYMRELLQSNKWEETKATLPVAIGKDVTGGPVIFDLAKTPHLLIAGTTGSGKSVCLTTIIISLLYRQTPEDLRLFMVDPKRVELQVYNTVPHMLVPVLSEAKKVPAAFKWLIEEMDRRYKIFVAMGVKNIAGFNAKILKNKEEAKLAQELSKEIDKDLTAEEIDAQFQVEDQLEFTDDDVEIPNEKLPYIVCIVDEFNDLMKIVGKEFEGQITRLTQLARAAGIHVILATQRPSVDVITGVIKANLPSRIALKVSSYTDSKTILDTKGAERLVGMGDMLILSPSESADLIRAQCAYVSDPEIESIVEKIAENGEPEFVEAMQFQIDSAGEDDEDDDFQSTQFNDPMTAKAVSVVRTNKKASTSLLQRKLGIGYGRAAKIIDELEDKGLIGPDKGQGNRDIFLD